MHKLPPRILGITVNKVRNLKLKELLVIHSFRLRIEDNLSVLAAMLYAVADQVVDKAAQDFPVRRHFLAAVAVAHLVDRELDTQFTHLHVILEGLHQISQVVCDGTLTQHGWLQKQIVAFKLILVHLGLRHQTHEFALLPDKLGRPLKVRNRVLSLVQQASG